MTTLGQISPFEEAINSLAQRKALPTNLGSAGLRQLGAEFHANSLVSARNNIGGIMDDLKSLLEKIINPTTEPAADGGKRTSGLDPATARLRMKELFAQYGYSAVPGEEGTIKDLASDKRINLFIKTNAELSRGRGWFIQSQDPDVLDAYPAQELVRIESRGKERDWPARWRMAAAMAGDTDAPRILEQTGRMIARRDSPIWQALGDGAGGFEDTLGNPFPPFAFSSGMGVRDIGYTEARRLDLLPPGGRVEPQALDFAKIFAVPQEVVA